MKRADNDWTALRIAAPGILGVVILAGCATTVPDADDMRSRRAERAATRVGELTHRTETAESEHLTGELSLDAAVLRALTRNLSLRRAREEREIASGRIQQSYSEALPSLLLNGSYLRRDRELGVLRDEGYAATRHRDDYTVGLRLSQPLFNGRIGAALRTGKLYRQWAEAGIRESEEDVRYEVIAAYYQAMLSEHLLEVNLTALETARRQLDDTRARREQGMASNFDRLRAEVEVSNFRAQALQARNDKDVAYTTLFRLIGASPGSEVRLIDPIPLVIESIDFDRALRIALEQRADLIEAEYALRMQRESLRVARGRYWPEVSGYLSQEWSNPDPHNAADDRWGDQWQAGLQVSLPLFDGMDRRGELIQERARVRQHELALRDLEEQVINQIRQLVLSLKTAEEFANSQNRNLETAREAVRLVEAGLREGQNTPVEVMDARQALTTASANYYKSLFDHAMTRVELQKAMGLLSGGVLPAQPVLPEDQAKDPQPNSGDPSK